MLITQRFNSHTRERYKNKNRRLKNEEMFQFPHTGKIQVGVAGLTIFEIGFNSHTRVRYKLFICNLVIHIHKVGFNSHTRVRYKIIAGTNLDLESVSIPTHG